MNRTIRIAVLTLLLAAGVASAKAPLPYRFLLVIGNQWKDPSSKLIEPGGELPVLLTLLKNWGLPFDILRLDQQRFDRYYLFDREDRPRYGTIIWDAGPGSGDPAALALLPALVSDYGMGLVALGDSVAEPAVAAATGLVYRSRYRLSDGLTLSGGHFITRGLEDRGKEIPEIDGGYLAGTNVEPRDAAVLGRRGRLPFLTARGRAVWLGADRTAPELGRQIVRDLLKRALVHAQGYALYSEYPRSVLLFMDDFGTSDRTYLPYWHYRTLDEATIRKGLIEPLKRHGAVLMEDVVSGYVDRKTRRIVSPWNLRVTDEIDGKTLHDYVSAKRGLDAGLREGVFEIQCHGYTHMLPDLESPPGPFWDAPMDGVATLGWDVEFGDQVRGKDVPAITQRFLMQRGIEYIRHDFGVTPLFVINGGGGKSLSYPHHSARLAAGMGFGLAHFNAAWYLGADFAAPMDQVVHSQTWAHERPAPVVAWTIDAPQFLVFHDRDISVDITAAERLLEGLGAGTRYLSANEYSGYLHARVERDAEAPALAVDYDGHYCGYFAEHASRWVLHLSDETRRELKTAAPEKRTVTIPKGTGRHVVRLGE